MEVSPHVVDQEERVPVPDHLPAMEGRQVVLDSKVDNGNIVLHLSVKCNHLDVLRLVLDSTGDDGEADVRKTINSLGKTISHLAVMLQRAERKLEEHSSNNWRKWVWLRVKSLMDYRGDWMNETKGALMTVSSIIATVTFAAAISPPGGVWQQDTKVSQPQQEGCHDYYDTDCYPCNNKSICVAGNAVLAYYYGENFMNFMKYNMISFMSSLVVLFLLVSGFPLSNKFCLWLLSLAMCVTISFLGLTFLEALWLVIPDPVLVRYNKYKTVSHYAWIAMICIVGVFLLIRLSSWLERIYNSPEHIYNSAYLKYAREWLLGVCSSVPKRLPWPENPYSHWKRRRSST